MVATGFCEVEHAVGGGHNSESRVVLVSSASGVVCPFYATGRLTLSCL
jgi:hypothetical protein